MDAKTKKVLSNNPLEYRSVLTIPNKINFGIELEMEEVDMVYVYNQVKSILGKDWNVHKDDSLKLLRSAEIVSPVLQNTKETWILIKKMGELLDKINPIYNKSSFQVNFDGSLLPTEQDRIRFLKLYAMYEDIIYRFSKGEDEEYRDSLETYAGPIILTLKGLVKDPKCAIEMFSNNKRYGIVFKSQKQDLIEFRTPNSTSNPILIQNYITTFYYLLKFVTSNKYPKHEVDEYIDKYMRIYILEGYEKCNEEKAIKFADMIFPKQIDKAYFLHQYLGKQK
jgi:hypothetical protein